MNATTFIKQSLVQGKTVTSAQVLKKFGSPKTPSRIGELERMYGFKVTRTPKRKKTSNGSTVYNVYSLDCAKWAKQIKAMN